MLSANVFAVEAQKPKMRASDIRTDDYRNAVAEIVRSVKYKHKLTNVALADLIGCSDGTIANAENAQGNLDPTTLIKMAAEFGPQIMEPIRKLYNRPLTFAEQIDDICERLQALKGYRQ